MWQSDTWVEFDRDLRIESLGLVREANRHPSRTGAPYWVLVLMDEGSRTLSLDGKSIRADKREFFLLPPNSNQQPLRIDLHTACYVHFFANSKCVEAPTRVDASRLILPMLGHLPVDPDCFALLRYLCDHAASPYVCNEFMSLQLLSLLSLISLHAQKTPRADGQKKLRRAEDILAFIKENLSRNLHAEDYEAFFGRSYHQLNAVFKRQFGCTVKQFHINLRMERAAELLRAGKSLNETALACGFDDYFFFIRSFGKKYGISPAVYQKQATSKAP